MVGVMNSPLFARDAASSVQQFAKWAAVRDIYQGPISPIGSYDAGCLSGADKLDKREPNLMLDDPHSAHDIGPR